jgi:hypothetical protein
MGDMETTVDVIQTGEHMTVYLLTLLIAVCIVIGWLIYWTHPRITDVSYERGKGLRFHMNSVSEFAKITGRLKDIDSRTARSIRQGTTGLPLLDPIKYGVNAEVMIVNDEAVDPLVYAAYENNHTKELANENGDDRDKKYEVYLQNKATDVYNNIKNWKVKFPEITMKLCDGFVYHWTVKVLIPNLLKACNEKIDFYENELERKDLSDTIQSMLNDLLQKNKGYIKCLGVLAELSEFQIKSGQFNIIEENL